MRQNYIVDIQLLESRQLLAAVTVSGSSSADDIRVYVQSNTIIADVGGIIQSYPDFLYDGIIINALGGADTIRVESNTDNPTTINSGNGIDSVYLGNGTLDGIEAPVAVTASSGDSLYLDDSADEFAETYNVNSGMISRSIFGGVTYSGIADVHIKSGNFDDTFNVINTAGMPLVIDAQGGENVLNLSPNSVGPADVIFENTQYFARVDGYTGGTLTLRDTAGLVLSTNLSNFDANLFLDRGFLLERNSQAAGGLNYWRDRLVGGVNNTTPQLDSTFADQSPINDAIGYGYAQNIAVNNIDGYDINSGDLLLRYTLRGDVDLNQTVNFDDLLKVAQNYSLTTTGRVWSTGDFNLSGKTDFDDLLALAQTYGQSALRAATSGQKRGPTRNDVLA